MDSNVAKTDLIVTLTCSFALFAPADALPKADRVVVIKHERKLTLMHAGKPLKILFRCSGNRTDRRKAASGRSSHSRGHVYTGLTQRPQPVFTNQFTSHIRAQKTASGLPGLASRQEGTFSFMDCRMATASWDPRTGFMTGPMGV